jgi:glycosyltransferase involved in cell wall biosynthesis
MKNAEMGSIPDFEIRNSSVAIRTSNLTPLHETISFPMRLLLLCTDAYGGHGGIALFNRELVAALIARDDVEEVVVVPRVIPHRGADPIPDKVTFIENAADGPFAYTRALRRVRGDRFDLVICGHVNLLPVARVVSPDPLLITHGIEAWRHLRDPLSERLLHHCRGIVSVSALTRDRVLAWSGYRGPTYVLPNAVHLERYGIRPRNPELVERYRLAGKRVLLTVGRIVSQERYKGFDEVIEVLPELPRDVVYLIAGGGNDTPRLRARTHELGVADRVVFTGLFAEEEKPDLYNLADVYVMPSRGEGFGFVFLEAMASGVPVIASSQDGGREAILGGRLGLLVDPTSSAAIRAAIEELLTRNTRKVPEGLSYFAFDNFVARVGEIVSAAVR